MTECVIGVPGAVGLLDEAACENLTRDLLSVMLNPTPESKLKAPCRGIVTTLLDVVPIAPSENTAVQSEKEHKNNKK